MLNRITKVLANNFAVEKKLFVYDSGQDKAQFSSGIRATIFGATGILSLILGVTGRTIAQRLGLIGS